MCDWLKFADEEHGLDLLTLQLINIPHQIRAKRFFLSRRVNVITNWTDHDPYHLISSAFQVA